MYKQGKRESRGTMRVIVIHLRSLLIGASVFLVAVMAALFLLVSNPLDLSETYFSDQTSVPTMSPSEDIGMTASVKPSLALDVKVEGNKAEVSMLTENFQFTEESAGGDESAAHGEGHAHVYLDGKLMQMLYGPEFVIKNIPPGEHELRVVLAYNNHLPYQVEAKQRIEVK